MKTFFWHEVRNNPNYLGRFFLKILGHDLKRGFFINSPTMTASFRSQGTAHAVGSRQSDKSAIWLQLLFQAPPCIGWSSHLSKHLKNCMAYAESFHCRSQWSLSHWLAFKVNCPLPRQVYILCTHSEAAFWNPSAARWFPFPDSGVRRKTSPCQFVLLSICSVLSICRVIGTQNNDVSWQADKSQIMSNFGILVKWVSSNCLDRCWKTTWLEDEVAIWTLVKLQNLITIKINEHHFRQELGYCILELWMWWGGPNSQYPNVFSKNRPFSDDSMTRQPVNASGSIHQVGDLVMSMWMFPKMVVPPNHPF